MTQPALLVATNKRPGLLDPIQHGLFVLETLLNGGDVGAIPPPPPHGPVVRNPQQFGDERQRANQRAMLAPCNACHTNFDGFGLTRYAYDSIGRFSNRYVSIDESVTPVQYSWVTSPVPLDNSAVIPDAVGPDLKGPLSGSVELAQKLGAGTPRRRVAYTAAKTMAAYVLGHDPSFENSCLLHDIEEQFSQQGSFPQLFLQLMTSPGFITRDPGR